MTYKKKIIIEKINSKKRTFVGEISIIIIIIIVIIIIIIIILICQKLESVGAAQQKIKLHSPN